jgi:adenylate cyclase
MKAHRRIILREVATAAGLFTATWYLFYLAGVWTTLDYFEEGPFLDYVTGPAIHAEMLVSGLGLGAILGLVGHIFEGTDLRLRPFGQIILIKSSVYVLGLLVMAVVMNLLFLSFFFSWEELVAVWGIMSPRLLAGLTGWAVFSIVGVNFLMEVRRKMGPGKLWALLTGRYHRPRDEHRVFLFLDMKGSTTITETLGHSRYSEFLRQVYHDLTEIVLGHEAEIYQYVGDEVVLTWPARRSGSGRRSLQAFFAFRKKLREKRDWYEGTFGVVPEFRGGVEVGQVTATEVGDIKRDIAFHGDPLNTAARLLELCREYEQPVLVSGKIHADISGDETLATELRGEVTLRGKKEPVAVYGVSPAA